MNTLEINIERLIHIESKEYQEFFPERETFNSPLILELKTFYNTIISHFETITRDQEFVLSKLFERFIYVQREIDPNRLKDFVVSMTDDEDLLLYRSSKTHLINLIIHPEEDFALSIINKEEGNILDFYDNKEADYEKIVYEFLK